MKYIFLVPDGMADYPLPELGGKTPLMASRTPFLDRVAAAGEIGRAATIPPGLSPGSDVANLSLLGYDPARFYTGRAPLEAANIGVKLGPDEIAFRCNLISVKDGLISDYSAGHITNEEARELIAYLNKSLDNPEAKFYAGVSYRNLLVIKSGDKEKLLRLKCVPPHDIMGKKAEEYLPQGEGEELLHGLMTGAGKILSKRCSRANMIWPWGQGVAKAIPSFLDTYKVQGSVISAVDLIKGLGKILSMRVVDVPGATGYLDTNYRGKAEYGLEELKESDLVYIHVEAPDEASHDGRLQDKIKALEEIDRHMVSLFWKALEKRKIDRLLIVADHFTPVKVRTHTGEPVPFVLAGEGVKKSGSRLFNEEEAEKSKLFIKEGHKLMSYFLRSEEYS